MVDGPVTPARLKPAKKSASVWISTNQSFAHLFCDFATQIKLKWSQPGPSIAIFENRTCLEGAISSNNKPWNNRILVIVDNVLDYEYFKTVLSASEPGVESQADQPPAGAVFGAEGAPSYTVDPAYSGREAVTKIKEAKEAGKPYALLFLHEILKGEWSSGRILEEIAHFAPYIEIVVISSSYSPSTDVIRRAHAIERLMFLKEPLDPVTVSHLALSLTKRWSSGHGARLQIEALRSEINMKAGELGRILKEIKEYSLNVTLKDPDDRPDYRILIVDDNPSIHDDFRKVLEPPAASPRSQAVELYEQQLFDDDDDLDTPADLDMNYKVDSAFQGREALDKVVKAAEEGHPYSLIFMDVRMPPGWDGIQTISNIWEFDPYIEMVIVSAHSDYTWGQIVAKIGSTDRLLFLKKPFDSMSIKQMALSLTQKWMLAYRARKNIAALESDVGLRISQLTKLLSSM